MRGVAALALLAGCSSLPASVNPVNWWDSLTDSKLATERPPPPQADAPYPNLASVPDKPAPADVKAHQSIVAGLVADRSNAQYETMQTPIADPSSPQASPALFGGSAPPPGAQAAPAAQASLPAANAPPANGTPAATKPAPAPAPVHPAPAPRNAVNQAPLAPPTETAAAGAAPSAAAPSAAPAAGAAGKTAAGTTLANGMTEVAATPPPTMPETPPPPPQVPGAAVPPTAPAPPPQKPPAPPPGKTPLSEAEARPLTIGFPIGSAVIPPAEMESIKGLAARRGKRSVAVVGYGDATNATPETQTEAVTLALARARAVIAALTAAGVPADAIAMDAEANGHGALARLVE